MLFSNLAASALLWQSTTVAAMSLEPMEQGASEHALEKRLNCKGRGNFVVYEFNNGDGGQSMLCLNGFVAAGCVLAIAGGTGILTTLQNKVSSWVSSKIGDASSAGPQAKRDMETTPTISWGEVFAYQSANGSTSYSGPANQDDGIVINLHEDGFSASASLMQGENALVGRSSCKEQVHVHYWAAPGHTSTALSSSDIGRLVYQGLSYSYQRDYGKTCFEMTNNGNWDGFMRVCYNVNKSQVGCYSCGGHNN